MNNRSVLAIQRSARGYLGRKEAMRRREVMRRELEKGDEEPPSAKKVPNRGAPGGGGDGGRSYRDERQRGGDHIHWGGRENHPIKGGGTPGQGKRRDKPSDDKSKAGGTKASKRHSS